MENILDDVIPTETLSVIEKRYNQEKIDRVLQTNTIYEYAHCLIKSQYASDVHRGVNLIEELFESNPDGRRDYLYYLAIGYTKLNNYSKAKCCIRNFLSIEPKNKQIIELENIVQKKLDDEGLKGILLVGGAAVVLGSILTAGLALFSKR